MTAIIVENGFFVNFVALEKWKYFCAAVNVMMMMASEHIFLTNFFLDNYIVQCFYRYVVYIQHRDGKVVLANKFFYSKNISVAKWIC